MVLHDASQAFLPSRPILKFRQIHLSHVHKDALVAYVFLLSCRRFRCCCHRCFHCEFQRSHNHLPQKYCTFRAQTLNLRVGHDVLRIRASDRFDSLLMIPTTQLILSHSPDVSIYDFSHSLFEHFHRRHITNVSVVDDDQDNLLLIPKKFKTNFMSQIFIKKHKAKLTVAVITKRNVIIFKFSMIELHTQTGN